MPFFVRNFGKMMDAEFGLTALLALGDGGIAVQRFELSPNGLEYTEEQGKRRENPYISAFKPIKIYMYLLHN